MTIVDAPSHGFADVDQAAPEASHFINYLDGVRAVSSIGQIDDTLTGIMARMGARRIVEIGCGTGDLLVKLTNACVPPAAGLGVEKSASLTREAAARHRHAGNLGFLVHDFNEAEGGQALAEMGYAPQSVDAIVLNRVVQHLETPEELLGNALPLLRHGGAVIVSDVDWRTLRLNHPDGPTTKRVIGDHIASIINPSAGSTSAALLRTIGLGDVRVELELVHRIVGFDVAAQVLVLNSAVARLVHSGRLSQDAADAWISVARAQPDFTAEVTQTIVIGSVHHSA